MKELNAIYTPSQAAERIDISQSSIRRYTIALEKAGYPNIKRSSNNHRRYDLYDIQVLQYFKDLVQEKKISFDMALEQTMQDLDYIKNKVDIKNESADFNVKSSDDIEHLETKINMLIEMVRELNVKTEALQEDNQRLTAYIKQQQLEMETEDEEQSSVNESAEDNDQTNIYEYIEEPEEKSDKVEQEKVGIFSKIKKWLG